jgi:hypothetical protein
VRAEVRSERPFLSRRIFAIVTLEGLFTGVRAQVFREGTFDGGGVGAKVTLVGSLASVLARMRRKRAFLRRRIFAVAAFEGFFSGVNSHVFGQITCNKPSLQRDKRI